MGFEFAGSSGESVMAGEVKARLDTRELDKIVKGLDKNIDDVLGNLAHQGEAYTKSYIWRKKIVDTGAYFNSINARRMKRNKWRWQDGVEYGVYQEFGTHKMAARTAFTPAAEKVARDLNSGKTWERLFK